jgi:hypothetical protein
MRSIPRVQAASYTQQNLDPHDKMNLRDKEGPAATPDLFIWEDKSYRDTPLSSLFPGFCKF